MSRENPRFDAAGVSSYGYRQPRPDLPLRPNVRGKLVIAAARVLEKKGIAGNFSFSGRAAGGETEPISAVAANEFIRTSHVRPDTVLVNTSAPVTTNQELKTLKRFAKKKNWKNLAIIGWENHKPRIEVLAIKAFKGLVTRLLGRTRDFTVFTPSEVFKQYLSEKNATRYKRIIDKIRSSEEEKRLDAYEAKQVKLLKIPFAEALLDFVANFYRPKAA